MNTPRTDAEVEKHGHGSTMRAHCLNSSHLSGDFADFARQLETELIAMTALADRLAEALDTLTSVIGLTPIKGNLEALQEAFIQARQSFASYENHKRGNTP